MKKVKKDEIIDVLKNCFDPEIPVDLWSLGLIYNISISNDSAVSITMTLTTPGCSMGSYMAEDIKMKLSSIENISDIDVEIIFDPPWKPEMMNNSAREKLGFPNEENKTQPENEEKSWE